DQQSESQGGWLPDHVRDLPHHRQLVGRDLQPHLVPDEPWQCQWCVLDLPYQSERFHGVHLYQLSPEVADRSEPSGRERLRLQQRQLLQLPQKWRWRRLSDKEGCGPGKKRASKDAGRLRQIGHGTAGGATASEEQ